MKVNPNKIFLRIFLWVGKMTNDRLEILEDRMKKLLILVLVFVIAMMIVSTAFAAPPCNDANGDGSYSGYEYAQNHIVPLANIGFLGQGHKPGTHHGFSVCDPSGQ